MILLLVSLGLGAPSTVEVLDANTPLFEAPDDASAVLRRLFAGEIVEASEYVTTPDGRSWVKLRLGQSTYGFVRPSQVLTTGSLAEVSFEPPRIIRDERPLALGMRIGGESYGPALQLRYLPFTRLGASFAAGALLDNAEMRGRAISFGINTFVVLWNLSPFAEVGLSFLSYHKNASTLRATTFYLTLGLEYMLDAGVYVALTGTLVRSIDLEVSYELEDAKDGGTRVSRYGVLDPKAESSLQALRPGVNIGYAF